MANKYEAYIEVAYEIDNCDSYKQLYTCENLVVNYFKLHKDINLTHNLCNRITMKHYNIAVTALKGQVPDGFIPPPFLPNPQLPSEKRRSFLKKILDLLGLT